MKEKIELIGKDLGHVINVFGETLYKLNDQVLDYSEMGERIFDQRNNYAHGNIDKKFIGLSLLDLMFLEMIIYAMQLSHYQLDDLSIQKAINKLFACGLPL